MQARILMLIGAAANITGVTLVLVGKTDIAIANFVLATQMILFYQIFTKR